MLLHRSTDVSCTYIADFDQVTIKVETHNLRAFFSVNFAFVPSECDSMVGDMSYTPWWVAQSPYPLL